MALISCPDCGSRISDQAKACPRCGRPIQSYRSSSEIKICPDCRNEIPVQSPECIYCGKRFSASVSSVNSYRGTCPRCHSGRIIFQREQAGSVGVSQNRVRWKRKKSCLELFIFGWFYIIKFVFFDWWIGLLRGNISVSGTINRTVAVCQNCGYTWKV